MDRLRCPQWGKEGWYCTGAWLRICSDGRPEIVCGLEGVVEQEEAAKYCAQRYLLLLLKDALNGLSATDDDGGVGEDAPSEV